MINYIMERLENNNISIRSLDEKNRIEDGIKKYLEFNGISCDASGEFYKRTVDRLLEIVDVNDMKLYFINFGLIAEVHQLLSDIRNSGKATQIEVDKAYLLLTELNNCGLGHKYIPEAEIKTIFGKNM